MADRTLELTVWPEECVRWFHATHFDSESWWGKKHSREEILADVEKEYRPESHEEGQVVCWIVSGRDKRPDFKPTPRAVQKLLQDYEDHNGECWFEDGAGFDSDDPDPEGALANLLAQVLESFLDPPESRMIDDFLTMEAVVFRNGEFVVDPDRVP